VSARELLCAACLLASAFGASPRPAAAAERRDQVAPYLQALESHTLGDVEGRALGEPRRASGDPVPIAGVSVLLLPFSPEVEAKLDGIKTHLRDKMGTYIDANAEVVSVRTTYERELLSAGGGELIRGAVSDEAGNVRLSGVPIGDWIMLAWREDPHAVKGGRVPAKEAAKFPDIPVITGYAAVSYWRARLSVQTGEVTSLNLTDRGVWLTAVREEFSNSREVTKKGSDLKKRR